MHFLTIVSKVGLADDQHDLGPDFVVDSWLERWWDLALQRHPLPKVDTTILVEKT